MVERSCSVSEAVKFGGYGHSPSRALLGAIFIVFLEKGGCMIVSLGVGNNDVEVTKRDRGRY
jgi:hypothetical protein